MRLIAFVNIPERSDTIPLDIIDDRPENLLLRDVLLFAKLSTREETQTGYCSFKKGNKLDLSLQLSQNGVENGDYLDLARTS